MTNTVNLALHATSVTSILGQLTGDDDLRAIAKEIRDQLGNDSYVVIDTPIEVMMISPATVPGVRVVLNYGVREGTTGEVVGWGRSRKAQEALHKALKVRAEAQEELTDLDIDPLVDAEGPLVRINGAIEWFPGQSIGILQVAPF